MLANTGKHGCHLMSIYVYLKLSGLLSSMVMSRMLVMCPMYPYVAESNCRGQLARPKHHWNKHVRCSNSVKAGHIIMIISYLVWIEKSPSSTGILPSSFGVRFRTLRVSRVDAGKPAIVTRTLHGWRGTVRCVGPRLGFLVPTRFIADFMVPAPLKNDNDTGIPGQDLWRPWFPLSALPLPSAQKRPAGHFASNHEHPFNHL